MRLFPTLCLLAILATLVIAIEPDKAPLSKNNPGKPAASKLDVKDKELREFAAQRAKLVRANTEPHLVYDRSIVLCEAPRSDADQEKKPDNPHENYAVMVYLTSNGRDMMVSGKGNYPVGTVILKEKMGASEEEHSPKKLNDPPPNARVPKTPQPLHVPKLFTGMLKREAGYNPECGDWEFFVVSGTADKLLARGKIDSCIACHQGYKTTDYVTRTYMPLGK